MSAPEWEPTPDPDLLKRVAGQGDADAFLALCVADAVSHEREVSVNRVRALKDAAGADFDPRAFSAYWSAFTGRGGPMEKIVGGWEIASGATSRNDGRPLPLRRWVRPLPPPTWLRRRGRTGEWAYTVELNPRGTGAHVHLWWRGDRLDAALLSEIAVAVGAGSDVDVRSTFAPAGTRVPELRYGLKAVLDRPDEVGPDLWPAAASHLELNGGRLVNATLGFWVTWAGERVVGGVERARTIANRASGPWPRTAFLESWHRHHESRDTPRGGWQAQERRQSEPTPSPPPEAPSEGLHHPGTATLPRKSGGHPGVNTGVAARLTSTCQEAHGPAPNVAPRAAAYHAPRRDPGDSRRCRCAPRRGADHRQPVRLAR